VIVFIVPVGRGNWTKQAVVIQTPDLMLEVRRTEVRLRDRWFIAGRWWRVVEVHP
jgi:hypothetical protein